MLCLQFMNDTLSDQWVQRGGPLAWPLLSPAGVFLVVLSKLLCMLPNMDDLMECVTTTIRSPTSMFLLSSKTD